MVPMPKGADLLSEGEEFETCDDCGRGVVTSSDQVRETDFLCFRLSQNAMTFFIGRLKALTVIEFSDVPFLDFDQDLEEFCDYTADAIGGGLQRPDLWQRPLDNNRVNDIASWLNSGASKCIPDAVLVGEKPPDQDRIDIEHMEGGIYKVTVYHELQEECPIHGPFETEEGRSVYRDRCEKHDCPHHEVSDRPLQIIDGQHRLRGIWNSNVTNQDVGVVFLPLPRPQEEEDVRGFDDTNQAEIFQQVNTKSEPLENLHQLWLRRFFDEGWKKASPDKKKAFDALMHLGGTQLSAAGNPNSWEDKVKAHPKGFTRPYIDTLTGVENPQGSSGVVAEIIGNLTNEVPVDKTPAQILRNYVEGCVQAYPNMWKIAGPGKAPFENAGLFKELIRIFPRVKAWAHHAGNTALSTQDLKEVWEHHADEFGPKTVDDWNQFAASGETPPKEFRTILELMWPDPPTGKEPPAAPDSETVKHEQGECPNWRTYIRLEPDPIQWKEPATLLNGTYHSDSKSQEDPASISDGDILQWVAPTNVSSEPDVHYREPDGPWIELSGSGTEREISKADMEIGPGPFELRVRYENIQGPTRITATFELT